MTAARDVLAVLAEASERHGTVAAEDVLASWDVARGLGMDLGRAWAWACEGLDWEAVALATGEAGEAGGADWAVQQAPAKLADMIIQEANREASREASCGVRRSARTPGA